MMVCEAHAIHSWTFTTLISAFLDLSIAYLLLCCSTLAFFASKLLSIFDLHLPCPCTNGLFNDPNLCVKTLIVDFPTETVSSLHMSIRTKFPFDSIPIFKNNQEEQQRCLNLKLVKSRDEMEGESSVSVTSNKLLMSSSYNGEGKGKAVVLRSSRSGSAFLRRRRRAVSDRGKVSSSDAPAPRVIGSRVESYSTSQIGEEIKEVEDDEEEKNRVRHAYMGSNVREVSRSSFQMTELTGEEVDSMDKDAVSAGESIFSFHKEIGLDGNETHSIRMLEQALEEEHAARNALYSELEEERSAAATAADEAMAMILRLQEEKASIEMEARQYQRMIEEKSAYDAEEMNILKEILLRREMEKHFLEKEVEAYRKNVGIGEEQLENDESDYMIGISEERQHPFDSSEDPVYMLQKISESISRKETEKNVSRDSGYDMLSIDEQHSSLGYRELSMDQHPSSSQHNGLKPDLNSGLLVSNEAPQLHEKTIIFLDGELKPKKDIRLCQGLVPETGQTHNGVEINFPCDVSDMEKQEKDPYRGEWVPQASSFETEQSVYDVHVIDDESKLSHQKNKKENGQPSDSRGSDKKKYALPVEASSSKGDHIRRDRPSTSRVETELNIHRSKSDMSLMSPMNGKVQDKSPVFDSQRASISSVDSERSKLETEVEWLRERLRIVQEGRDKLSFSVDHREREQMQLQLLEAIANQLQEIRQLTEPGKAVRQASLPPASSKVTSKKRRYRGVPWGVHGSS